jgi:hypothetical protein
MAEKEPNAPSSAGKDAGASDAPRPIARRPHPVIKPSTEVVSLQQIGGGSLQPPGTPPVSSGPVTPAPSAPVAPATPAAAVLNAPTSPPSLAGIGSRAPVASSASEPSSGNTGGGLPIGNSGGLSAVGLGGAGSASPVGESGTSVKPPPDLIQPYPTTSARPDIARRPVGPAAAEESGFDSQKAVKIGVGVVVAILAFFIVRAAIPSKIPVPTAFTTYTSASGVFALDAPEGWNRKGVDVQREDGLTGQQSTADADGATITSGKAIIQVWTDSGGDAMQNQLLSGGGPNFAALLDDKNKEFMGIMKKRVSGFTETDSTTFSLAPFGAKVVEYTGTSGFLIFGGKVHGYAATVQGPKHFMQILLQCPENNWDDLKPVYERILKSAALDGVSAKTLQERLGGFGGGGGAPAVGGGGRINIPGGGSVSLPSGAGGF